MKIVRYGLAVTIIVIASLTIQFLWFTPLTLNQLYFREFTRLAIGDPELMTQLGLLANTPFDFYNDELTPASLSHQRALGKQATGAMAALQSFDRSKLSGEPATSFDVFKWTIQDLIDADDFYLQNYAITQNDGAYLDLVDFMSRIHQVKDLSGANDYLARLKAIAAKMDDQLALSKLQAESGVLPPDFIIERLLGNLHNIRDKPVASSEYITSFSSRLAELNLPEQETRALVAQALKIVEDSVYPAYDRTIAYFDAKLLVATSDAGVWKLPKGKEYYEYRIRRNTTTTMSAPEIHELGLREVARIEAEMSLIFAQQGYTNGTPAELLQQISEEARFQQPQSDEAKQALVQEYQSIIDEIKAGAGKAFHHQPKAALIVKRIPKYKEATSASHYSAPSADRTRPGVFFVDLTQSPPRWTMRTLAYHEGIPGHHFQIALQREITGVPFFRTILPFTAYSEGWALYAERLAWEMGYQDDPFDNIGRLQAELFRAVRLVVDTGIHHQRWSKEQAMAYFDAHLGDPNEAEVERYVVWPGQALAYKVGMMKILSLREHAKQRLGKKFDLADFHDVVLQGGALPMDILEQAVETYIAEGLN